MAEETIFVGTWLSTFVYKRDVDGEECDEKHVCAMYQKGHQLVLESMPGANSYLLIRLTVDGQIVAGSWEQQYPKEAFGGARFWGAVQMIAAENGKMLQGMWIGFGSAARVTSGSWEIVCIDISLEGSHPKPLEASKSIAT